MSARERFEAMYEAHAGAVKAYALRRGAATDAEDVVAEVFLLAWRRLSDVPEDARGWLLGAARKIQSNARRGAARRQALREALEHERPPDHTVPRSADERLVSALLGLEEDDREALLLIAWEGLSYREAATVLGLRESAFGVRLHRARRRLANALRDDGPSSSEIPTRIEVR